MTGLLLAEELFLLTHDDDTGKEENALALTLGLAGAVLLDLASAGLLEGTDDRIVAVPGTAAQPLLRRAHEVLVGEKEPRKVRKLTDRLIKELHPFGEQVGRSLVERGILAEEHTKVLGIFSRTRWPERDPQAEQALRAGLVDVLVGGVPPSPHLALLITILSTMNLVRAVVDKPDRKGAQRRAKEIADSDSGLSTDVAASIRNAQAAIFAATMVPMAVAATSAST